MTNRTGWPSETGMRRGFHSTVRTVALALIACHLLAVAMASSPALHQWMHGDADEPGHHCAAATVVAGQVDQPDVASVFARPANFPTAIASSIVPARALPTAFRACAQERAPPAV
ncbi:MAG: hypothetical protein PHC88_07085 [Terrimicrobiaceae bacterium]|nr:hypothetical protein [Terrimicrobiaceae bacterium]